MGDGSTRHPLYRSSRQTRKSSLSSFLQFEERRSGRPEMALCCSYCSRLLRRTRYVLSHRSFSAVKLTVYPTSLSKQRHQQLKPLNLTWVYYMRWKITLCEFAIVFHLWSLTLIDFFRNSYGYQTNTRVKFVVILALADAVIRDVDVKTVRFYALHFLQA